MAYKNDLVLSPQKPTSVESERFWSSLKPDLAAGLKQGNEGRRYIACTIPTSGSAVTEFEATLSGNHKLQSRKARLFLFEDAIAISNGSKLVIGFNLPFIWVSHAGTDQQKMSHMERCFTLIFPEETVTVTCATLEGKTKLIWSIATAIKTSQKEDSGNPRVVDLHSIIKSTEVREKLRYNFVEKGHDLCGCIYTGPWYKGKPHGDKGDLENIKEGFHYRGRFSHGKFEGTGEFVFSQETKESSHPQPQEYRGDFENGKFNGYGDMRYYNGDVYEGWWKDGKKHGFGTYIEKGEKKSLYIGTWENDKRSGYGVLEDKTMFLRYMGMWSNDVHSGNGLVLTSVGTYCEAVFTNGSITEGGEGYIVSLSGNSFKGKIGPNLKLSGEGLLTIVNGTSKPVQLRGTFSGTWDAEIHCDKANIHNLFEQQRKDKENRVSTILVPVDQNIGVISVRASEKWRALIEHCRHQLGIHDGAATGVPYHSLRNWFFYKQQGMARPKSKSMSSDDRGGQSPSNHPENSMKITDDIGAVSSTNQLQTATNEAVESIFSDPSHPINLLLIKLTNNFCHSYSGIGASKFLLVHAIHEAKEIVQQLHAMLRFLFPTLRGDQTLLAPFGMARCDESQAGGINDWVDIESGYDLIHPYVFEKIYPTLWTLYVLHFDHQSSKYAKGLRVLGILTDLQLLKYLEADKKVIKDIEVHKRSSRYYELIYKSAHKLDGIKAMYTPREIIGCLKDVFVGIEEASGSEGLDDLFPLLVMTVVRAEFPRLGAYVLFLNDFAWEHSPKDVKEEYVLTTFESVYQHIYNEAERFPSETKTITHS